MSACLDQNSHPIVDCWNRIGVWGRQQPRCEKLEQVIHCRNCQVYVDSGRQILQRGISAEQVQEATDNIARGLTRKSIDKDSGVIFRIGDEWLLLGARRISEITPRTTIHRLPHHVDRILLGLANIRGELKVCISLARLLDIDTSAYAANDAQRVFPRMLVAGNPGEEFVFPVDEVRGMHRYDANELQNAPATVARANPTYTRGVLDLDGRHIACLDDELLFYAIGRNLL